MTTSCQPLLAQLAEKRRDQGPALILYASRAAAHGCEGLIGLNILDVSTPARWYRLSNLLQERSTSL